MSAVIQTTTMFVDRECLLEALDTLGVSYQITNHTQNTINSELITTDLVDYYGNQKFLFQNDRYVFLHDSTANTRGDRYPWGNIAQKEWKTATKFLEAVEIEYLSSYNKKMERIAEIERKIQEEKLRQLVESQRDNIVKKAKEMGYHIKEKKQDNKIRLVLSRTTR